MITLKNSPLKIEELVVLESDFSVVFTKKDNGIDNLELPIEAHLDSFSEMKRDEESDEEYEVVRHILVVQSNYRGRRKPGYSFKVRVGGLFSINEEPDSPIDNVYRNNLLSYSTVSILYNVVRNQVRHWTSTSDTYGVYVIPAMDIGSFISNQNGDKNNDN